MKNILVTASFALFLLFTYACTPTVGGPCEYERLKIEATVTEIEEFGVRLDHPRLEGLSKTYFPEAVKVGDRFQIDLDLMTKGTCNPVSVHSIDPIEI